MEKLPLTTRQREILEYMGSFTRESGYPPTVREICRATLEACGYQVMTARDGADAIDKFSEHRASIQAVVVDLLRHDREDFRRQMGQASLGFEPETLARAMRSAGLERVSVRPLPPEGQAKGPALVLATGSREGQVIDLRSPATGRKSLKGRKSA